MLKSIGFNLIPFIQTKICANSVSIQFNNIMTGLYNVCLCVGRIIRINLYFSVSIISLLNSAQPNITRPAVYHCKAISLAAGEYNWGTLPYEGVPLYTSFLLPLQQILQFPVFLISGRNRAPQSRISCPQQAGLPYSRIKEPAGPKEITAVCRARPLRSTEQMSDALTLPMA